eukprot:CAMPEP_0168627222 /NCGR_PEP_ID=MMETSP0449_2-20121227/11105_1 /TAXON_ID=1082188 /ORGANISM="Strombidium rassoulzadegani, Strain ras09" /LENGTH=191 /DNA_ID=CAMNT_0008669379 /DNA_START=277 /DNA_END=853 /DNA_ORIENTATION=-
MAGWALTSSFSDGESLLGSLLLGDSDLLLVLSGDGAALLGDVELDVAVGRQVRRDSSVGSVGSSSALDGSLGADVGDLALFDVELLGLGVGLEVSKEGEHVVNGLGGEPSVVVVKVLAHGLAAGASSVPSEWDDGFVLEGPLHVLNGLEQVEASASAGGLISVLVVDSEALTLHLALLVGSAGCLEYLTIG